MSSVQTWTWRGFAKLLVSPLLLWLAFASAVKAAVIESVYTSLGGNHWSVAFSVKHDAEPVPINEFTIYFPESLFSNLQLQASPDTWDSLVIQPDLLLPAAGFLDGLVLDARDALTRGRSQGGFLVSFDFLAAGLPSSLHFETLDDAFRVIGTGVTVVAVTDVPEPPVYATLVLAGLALLTRGLLRTRRKVLLVESSSAVSSGEAS